MAKKPRDESTAAAREAKRDSSAAPSLFIRIKFGDRVYIGPGKIRLMELIDEHGSISAAGRAMRMSYRRAWMMIDSLNAAFTSPLVVKQTGGSGGGGAILTDLGREIVERYRRIERAAEGQSAADLAAISKYVSKEG